MTVTSMSGWASTKLPSRGTSQRVPKDGMTVTASRPDTPAAAHVLHRPRQMRETPPQLRHAGPGRLGELEPACQPAEQHDVEDGLELAHLLADRGRRDGQLLGRLDEAGVTGGRLEGAKSGQRRQALGMARLSLAYP